MKWRAAMFGAVLASLSGAAAASQGTSDEDTADLVIRDVSVVDVAAASLLEHRTVVVEDGLIAAVLPAGAPVPAAGQVVDGSGQYLVPGLIDMHVHADRSTLPLFLEHGVTTIRDMGTHFAPLAADAGGQLAMRAEIAAGELSGPEMFLALRILDSDVGRDPRWAMHFAAVATAEQGRDLVDQVADAGGDFIKVYSDLDPDVFTAIAEQASARGLRLAGHVPGQVGYARAAEVGLHTAEHLRGMFIDLSSEELHWRSLYTAEAELGDPSATYNFLHGRFLEMAATRDPAKEAALFQILREEQVGIVPTLVVLDDPRWRYPSTVPDPELVARLSRIYRMIVTPAPDVTGPFASVADAQQAFEEQAALVGRMHQSGVTILVGTDATNPFVVPGISMHEELGNLVRAGLTPSEALRAATLTNARFLDAEARLGSVEAGKEADLLLVQGNPLQDIAALRDITLVVVDGRALDPAAGQDETDADDLSPN